MRNVLLAAALAAVTMGPVWAQEPDDLLERWLRSTPEKRATARELLLSRYPDLAGELQTWLGVRYPEFELKAARALVNFTESHPGVWAGVGRHLLEDLGGEPADAFLDVAEAVTARYPELPGRLVELRRNQGAAQRLRELVAGRYPHLRTQLLELLAERPPVSFAAVRARHPGLGREMLLELSRLADERFPGLTREFLLARRQGARPFPWLLEKHPDFVLQAARRLQQAQGAELRQAALEVLAQAERRERSPGLGRRVLQLIQERYPAFPREARAARREAGRELRTTLRREFPELLPVASQTMQREHPELLARAAASVRKHFPTLRDDLWQALEGELPGLRQELKEHLARTHPELRTQVEQLL